MERFVTAVVHHRIAVVAAVALVTIALGTQLRHLHLEIRRRANPPGTATLRAGPEPHLRPVRTRLGLLTALIVSTHAAATLPVVPAIVLLARPRFLETRQPAAPSTRYAFRPPYP